MCCQREPVFGRRRRLARISQNKRRLRVAPAAVPSLSPPPASTSSPLMSCKTPEPASQPASRTPSGNFTQRINGEGMQMWQEEEEEKEEKMEKKEGRGGERGRRSKRKASERNHCKPEEKERKKEKVLRRER